jgi:hypothetical protein
MVSVSYQMVVCTESVMRQSNEVMKGQEAVRLNVQVFWHATIVIVQIKVDGV